ncbi:MAG: hypothetical protein J5777_06335 [Clostridiales bacterium]|nr:hypothetical protein [Clostridiales bacterium]
MAKKVTFEYKEGSDVVLVTIPSGVSGNEFRNPLKDSCNLLREKSGAAYFIDIDPEFSPDESDKEWLKQHFITLVKRSCAGRIILILPDEEKRAKFNEEFESLIGYFFADDYAEAVKVLCDVDLKEKDNGPKIAGKTKNQWRDHFSYVWFKYSIFPIAIAIIAILFFGFFSKSKNDVIVYSFGFFEHKEEYMEGVLKEAGFKVPYFPSAVVVMPNQEGKKPTEYENESATAYFMTVPDIIVSDGVTYGYFYQSFGVYPESYEKIYEGLSEEAKKHVERVYMSAVEADEYVKKYNAWSGRGDPEIDEKELNATSDVKAIIGFRITDPEACKKLGYSSGWTKSDSSLIFSMYAKCTDREKAEKAMTAILNSAF